MKRKKFYILLFIVLPIILISTFVYGKMNNNQIKGVEDDPLNHFETILVECRYVNNHKNVSTVFDYNDGLFLKDSTEFSPDIAKASVVLACAAYNSSMINTIFSKNNLNMSYVGNGKYNYSRTGSINDMDYVAYSFGRKVINYNGVDYALYCIPVRGTPGSIEWFSNFKLGTRNDGFHEGFYAAADEVINNMNKVISKDSIPKERRIIWIMGHSRGAAVSNLVAGRLSTENYGIADKNHIFCYTFACPSVGKNVDESLTNIYNFNNPGDCVPTLPFEEWGYSRYGKTEILDLNQFDNVTRHFDGVFKGTKTTEGFKNTLKNICPQENDYNTPQNQFIFGLFAYILDGNKDEDCSFTDFLSYTGYNMTKATIDQLKYSADLSQMKKSIDQMSEDCVNNTSFLEQAISTTSNMSDEEFETYISENQNKFDDIKKAYGYNIRNKTDLDIVLGHINEEYKGLNDLTSVFSSLIGWMVDTDYKIMESFTDGHTQSTYVTWINSMYYGCEGWGGNDKIENVTDSVYLECCDENYKVRFIGSGCFEFCDNIKSVTLDDVIKIGADAFSGDKAISKLEWGENIKIIDAFAFYDCSGIEHAIEIPDNAECLDYKAFAYCTGIPELILPVDIENYYSFEGCTGIKKITFTKGKTGVMRDRLGFRATEDYDNANVNYNFSIGYCTTNLETVVFKEGVTHIGDYAFFNDDERSNLTVVEMTSDVSSIGEGAFGNCKKLNTIDLSGVNEYGKKAFLNCYELESIVINNNVTELPDSVFAGCVKIKQLTLPLNLKTIGFQAFDGCAGIIKSIVIPEDVESIGTAAFRNCDGFSDITIPVDVKYADNTFEGCLGIQKITYTKGKSGVMLDRYIPSSGNEEENQVFYKHTLEYCARNLEEVVFEEGITRIGNYSFYEDEGKKNLIKVRLASSIKSIGSKFNNKNS